MLCSREVHFARNGGCICMHIPLGNILFEGDLRGVCVPCVCSHVTDSYRRQFGSGLDCYVPCCCSYDVNRALLPPFVDLVYNTTDVDLHPVLDYDSDDDNEDDHDDGDDDDDDRFFPSPPCYRQPMLLVPVSKRGRVYDNGTRLLHL